MGGNGTLVLSLRHPSVCLSEYCHEVYHKLNKYLWIYYDVLSNGKRNHRLLYWHVLKPKIRIFNFLTFCIFTIFQAKTIKMLEKLITQKKTNSESKKKQKPWSVRPINRPLFVDGVKTDEGIYIRGWALALAFT